MGNAPIINITMISILIVVLYILSSIKILREYERGVIFRLGRVLPRAKGPGIILVFAPIDRMVPPGKPWPAHERDTGGHSSN